MPRLWGALLLVVPSGTSCLSLGGQLPGARDFGAQSSSDASAARQRDDPDYSPYFDEDVETAIRTSALMGGAGGGRMDPKSKIATSMFTEVDMLCDTVPRPLSDHDERLGSGNPVCRYEPQEDVLQHYADHPADIAIVIPSNYEKDKHVSDNASDHDPLFLGVLTWKMYARYHGYAFYSGPPEKSCPELEERHPAWTKPCMAMGLIEKHKYLLVVDRDTTVIKPRLRLEPLFAAAGLMNQGANKVLAVAEEWGSCKKGVRSPLSGDVNTGIVLVKQSQDARDALATWFYGPTWCKNVTADPVDIPVWWPFHEEPCNGCSCITHGVHKWSYDQIGFYASVASNESFSDKVTVFRSGCPINSPFADFIPHLVSGSPTKKAYDANHREVISQNLHDCVSKLMDLRPGQGNLYQRCSLCDALPQGFHPYSESWSLSCRSHTPVPKQELEDSLVVSDSAA
mmetsp:Transcript_42421/g.114002  ORF Transcript_42421/g.114002 Transcript_42421/m.114002 type:complete len:455 (+) Transcript_42421:67-1431(+)